MNVIIIYYQILSILLLAQLKSIYKAFHWVFCRSIMFIYLQEKEDLDSKKSTMARNAVKQEEVPKEELESDEFDDGVFEGLSSTSDEE